MDMGDLLWVVKCGAGATVGVIQLLQFQGTTRPREIFVEFGPPTGRQLSFSRGITSEKVEPCTEPRPESG